MRSVQMFYYDSNENWRTSLDFEEKLNEEYKIIKKEVLSEETDYKAIYYCIKKEGS
jgi:hypothetical protein